MRRSSLTTPAPTRDMLAVGIDINPDKKSNLGAKREKKGECPTCGAQTHKVSLFGKKKTPLTVEGSVYKGRCLKCHPLEGYIRRPPPNGSQPQQQRNQPFPNHRQLSGPQYQQQQQQQDTMHPPQHQSFLPEPLIPPYGRTQQNPQQRQMTYQQSMQTQQIQQQMQQIQTPTQQQQPIQQRVQYEQEQFHGPTESGIAVPRTLEVLRMDDDNVSVITMDYRLAQGARNFVPSEGIDYDSEDDGMNVPLPKGRPGPDSGEDYSNRNRAAAQGAPIMRAPMRTMPSYSRNPSMRSVQGHGIPPRGPSLHGIPPSGGSYSEGPPQPAQRQTSRRMSRKQPSNGNMGFQPQNINDYTDNGNYNRENPDKYIDYKRSGGGNGTGFDEDGYPIADGDYGWDNQADMLPPGGMDGLLRGRIGEARTSQHTRRSTSQQNAAGEIQFQPGQAPPPSSSGPLRPSGRITTQSNDVAQIPNGLDRQVSNSHSPARNQSQQKPFTEDSRMVSIASGPSYLQDDFPGYDVDIPQANSQTRLRAQASGPAYLAAGVNRSNARLGASSRNGTSDGMPLAPDSLRASKTTGFGTLPRYGTSTLGATNSLDSTSHSTYAPPLVSRDQRGRPDSTRIQDPSMMTVQTNRGPSRPTTSGGLIDDDEQSVDDIHPPLIMPGQGLPKDAPPMYAPEMSPETDSQAKSFGMTRDQVAQLSHAGLEPSALEEVDEASSMPTRTHQVSQQHGVSTLPKMFRNQPSSEFGAPRSGVILEESSPASAALIVHNAKETVDQVSSIAHVANFSEKGAVTQARFDDKNNGSRTNKRIGKEEIEQIPMYVSALSNPENRTDALHSLADTVWKGGDSARDIVLQNRGIEELVKIMWDDIGDASLLDSALDFLLALASSSDGKDETDVLSNEESFCDSLLFSMQMHGQVPSIQLKGCSILASLAASSATNRSIADGSLSGAILMILGALNNHRQSLGIQKAGLQALYFQCTTSSNSESNRRTLVESHLDNGISGIDVLVNSMQCIQEDLSAMEFGCRLCWSLSSSQYEEVVKEMSSNPILLREIIQTCRRNIQAPDGFMIVEACFGAIGNLAHVEHNKTELREAGAIELLVEGMRAYRNSYSINIEVCSAIANLAGSTSVRDTMVRAGGVGLILRAIESYIENAEFIGEAIRALVCLAIHSLESKEAMAVPEVIGLITDASARHQENCHVQEMCCTLFGTLAVGRGTSDIIIEGGGLDVLTRALKLNSAEKVHNAACGAYCNLSCQVQDAEPLMQKSALKLLVQSMSTHMNSMIIQRNACCTIWNLAFKTQKHPGDIIDYSGVQAIVKAMQNHIESADLLEVACGALWSLVHDSIDRKKDVVANGAIDAVVCALVMHPTTTPTVTKACGVFSNISYEGQLAEAIANAQGISVLVDAIRNNGNSVTFLEIGCLTLRNIIFQIPDCAAEASMAISTVIDAMKENIDATGFQKEACSLLWVLASEAESCHSKILALDGIAVLMKCLEHNSYDPNVQEAALGAFNQLAAAG